MKDEHDNHTGDFLQAAGDGGGPVSGHTASPAAEDERCLYEAQQRACQLMETWLPPSLVARQWNVSSRRVRALLASGRLKGRQNENGYWEVSFPYTITEGRRGPPLRRREAKNKLKKVELRPV